MPVTLDTLLRQRALGLTVLAGGAATGRDITWVHASELADPTPFLDGGELLLTVGLWLGAEPVDAYVRRLVDARVAGLGFGIAVRHEKVPDELVAAAEEHGLPLVDVPERTPFIAVSRAVWESLAADQYAEVTRTSAAQQELTRAAVGAGVPGLVRRIAERFDGWALLLDAAGAVEHAHPAPAARRGAWMATELERFRDLDTPISATLSVDADQIVVQSIRLGRRNGGYLAVGSAHRLGKEQRTVLNTAVSLLTLMLARSSAQRAAEARLRAAILDLLVDGAVGRAAALADDLWGGLPREPVRVLLVEGDAARRADLAELVAAASAGSGERVFQAEYGEQLVLACSAVGRMRERVVAAAGGVTVGESTDAPLAQFGRALREAEESVAAGVRAQRAFTAFPDVGAVGLLGLLDGPAGAAFARSVLRPLLEHDTTGRGDLVRSLATWLDHHGEWDAAASALGVHRHTLRQRIKRAEALLARDLAAAAVRTELWVAVRLLDDLDV